MSFRRPAWWCTMGHHENTVRVATDADTGQRILVSTCSWCGAQEIRPLPLEVLPDVQTGIL